MKKRLFFAVLVLLYNVLGTLTICSISGSDLLYGDWTIWMSILTLPVIGISYIYRFAEADYSLPIVLAIQLAMFLINLFVVDAIVRKSEGTIHNDRWSGA